MQHITGNIMEIAERAAPIICDTLAQAIKKNGLAILGVSPTRSSALMARAMSRVENLNWRAVHIIEVHECCVPHDDEEYGYTALYNRGLTFLQRVGVPDDHIHPFVFLGDRLDKGVGKYRSEWRRLKGMSGTPEPAGFDAALLNCGADGRLGGLFPNHPSSFIDIDDYITVIGAPPAQQMSASREMLQNSTLLMLFVDSEAAPMAPQIAAHIADERYSIEKFPASLAAQNGILCYESDRTVPKDS